MAFIRYHSRAPCALWCLGFRMPSVLNRIRVWGYCIFFLKTCLAKGRNALGFYTSDLSGQKALAPGITVSCRFLNSTGVSSLTVSYPCAPHPVFPNCGPIPREVASRAGWIIVSPLPVSYPCLASRLSNILRSASHQYLYTFLFTLPCDIFPLLRS